MHDSNVLFIDCDKCNGTGRIEYEPESGSDGEVAYRKCTACHGFGMIETTWDEYEEMHD